MQDWNVVVTVFDETGYRLARRLLSAFGRIDSTDYFNVLVMRVEDIEIFTRAIGELFEKTPGYLNSISRVVPAHATIDYQSPEEFVEEAKRAILEWSDVLAGKSFHIRLHRRGFKGEIISPEMERSLDGALLERLEQMNRPGSIDFENPDMVVDIEMVGNRAGLSAWSRDELARYAFLHID